MNTGHILSKKDVDISELRNLYNVIDNYPENTLPKHGKNTYFNKDIPTEDKNKMIQMYKDGYDTYTIGKVFCLCYKQILTVLKDNNIQRIYNSGKRKYNLNELYFDKVDTPNKAYILGFLYADGNNDLRNNLITLSLQEGDLEILEKIKNEIGSNRPIRYIDYSNYYYKGKKMNFQNQYRLDVQSYHMSQTLYSHGMVDNKSLILTFPKWLDIKLYSHFIRGYFDGDGCLCISKTIKHNKKNPVINYSLSLVSTYNFLYPIQQHLINVLGIRGGSINDEPYNNITKELRFHGKSQVKLIADYLYQDATLFLERKHQKYLCAFY